MNSDVDKLLLNLANRLKTLRTQKGFSQESFADAAKLDRTYISGLERGKRNPSYLTLLKIASTLEISISEFLEIGDENDSN